MSVVHLVYIPAVLVVGLVLGYLMGARAAKKQIDKAGEQLRH